MQLSDNAFRGLVIGTAVLLGIMLIRVRFYGGFELPATPDAPVEQVADAKSVAKRMSGSTDAYKSYLLKDAARFGTSASEQTMAAVFPYQVDSEERTLAIGDRVEVLGLSLRLSSEKISGSRRSHMILTIENPGYKALAYRIETRPSTGARSCSKMSQIPHNAIAVAAGGVEKRAECLFRENSELAISKVETISLPELGFHYVSSLSPEVLGLDERNSRLHRRPSDAMPCELLQSTSMRNAVQSGEIHWKDQVDFYARHRCATYSLPRTYKAFQRDGEQNLPVSDEDL